MKLKNHMQHIISIVIVQILFVANLNAQNKETITCAWYPWTPYQYLDTDGSLSGLDYALITHIFKNAGITVDYDTHERKTWKDNQQEVLQGTKTITSGAFWTEERSKKYLVSDPYRYEWNALYIHRDDEKLSKISNIDTLINYIKSRRLKLGVVSEYTYNSEKINDFISNQKKEHRIKNLNDSLANQKRKTDIKKAIDFIAIQKRKQKLQKANDFLVNQKVSDSVQKLERFIEKLKTAIQKTNDSIVIQDKIDKIQRVKSQIIQVKRKDSLRKVNDFIRNKKMKVKIEKARAFIQNEKKKDSLKKAQDSIAINRKRDSLYQLNGLNSNSKKHKGLILESFDDEENLENLVNHKVDIIIADRITGAQIIWKNKENWKTVIAEHNIQLPKKSLHLLMHKGNTQEVIKSNQILMQRFNESLKSLKKKNELKDVIGGYLFPVLLNITVQTKWFSLVDYIGAIFFALTGFLMARERRFDIFGTLVMIALLTCGGGIIRDLLVDRTPSFLVDVTYLYIILNVSFICFLLARLHTYLVVRYKGYYNFMTTYSYHSIHLRRLIESIALGAYTIVGVGVAVQMNLKPLWLWGPVLGVVTSCGGGILTSCLMNTNDIKTLRTALDPEVSIFGGLCFSFFLLWQIDRLNPTEVFLAVLTTIGVMTLLMALVFGFNLKSPTLQLDEDVIDNKENKLM